MPPSSKTELRSTSGIHRGHLQDLTRALGQQMFFWGRDVLTEGNLLLSFGLKKHPSPGLKGTSCYRCPWQDGVIELHGACAGWYPHQPNEQPGFLFIRQSRACFTHRFSGPVIPGDYPDQGLKSGPLGDLVVASRTFTAWLCEYETWVRSKAGRKHREDCYRMFRRLPASIPWLPPTNDLPWLTSYAGAAPGLARARRRR